MEFVKQTSRWILLIMKKFIKTNKLLLVAFVLVFVVLAVIYFLRLSKQQPDVSQITNFSECEKAGFPIMESYPRQCRAGGKTFVEELKNDTGDDGTTSGSRISDLPMPKAVVEARKRLAGELEINEDDIVILEALEKDWGDGCLGLPQDDEMCTQAIVPGYSVLLMADGREFRYRTDKLGEIIKLESTKTTQSTITL